MPTSSALLITPASNTPRHAVWVPSPSAKELTSQSAHTPLAMYWLALYGTGVVGLGLGVEVVGAPVVGAEGGAWGAAAGEPPPMRWRG